MQLRVTLPAGPWEHDATGRPWHESGAASMHAQVGVEAQDDGMGAQTYESAIGPASGM